MTSKVENPPAFPLPLGQHNCSEPSQSGGMTLRDYFAGQAIYAARSIMETRHIEYKQQAREAYALADAMLRARGE